MSCKFKDPENPRRCRLTAGECQFIEGGFDDRCPILHAFSGLEIPETINEDEQQ